MAFEPILLTEIIAGKFAKAAMFLKIKNSLDFLNGELSSQARNDMIPNKGFDLDGDEDGNPDYWALAPYAGGTVSRDDTESAHGSACLKMVHPGGAGNGGGNATSDYVGCFAGTHDIRFLVWATAHGVHNRAELLYYDRDKLYLTAETIYNASGGASLVPIEIKTEFTAPSTARYYRVKLYGGVNDVDAAGSIYFDNVLVDPKTPTAAAAINNTDDVAIAEASTGNQGAWNNIGIPSAIDLDLIDGGAGGVVRLQFTAQIRRDVGTGTVKARFEVGGIYSNEISTDQTTYQSKLVTIDLTGITDKSISVQAQADPVSVDPTSVYLKVIDADTTVQYIAP